MSRLLRIIKWARVPYDTEVRLLIGMMMLAVALPRLSFVHDFFRFAEHRFGDPAAWGTWFFLIGIAMIVTCYRWSSRPTGRIVAGLAVFSWVALMAASTSTTSTLVDFIMAWFCLWEAGRRRDH